MAGYAVVLVSGGTVVLGFRHFSLVQKSSLLRSEVFNYQQSIETLQPQVAARRVQMEGQQDRLMKGSAISQSVGPAVIADIALHAQKANSMKLRELLTRHGFLEGGRPEAVDNSEGVGRQGKKHP